MYDFVLTVQAFFRYFSGRISAGKDIFCMHGIDDVINSFLPSIGIVSMKWLRSYFIFVEVYLIRLLVATAKMAPQEDEPEDEDDE